jgi:ubiquinone/menaquinone biosynthesis C-methylase UbiE
MNSASEMLPAYFRLMNASGAAHVYREAVRCGMLDALAAGPKTTEEVAQKCGTVGGPTELMLQALVSLALASQTGQTYQLTPLAELLLASSYRNLGDEYWVHLPTLLRTGKPLVRMDDVAQSEAHYQAQAAVLGWMLTPAAKCAAQLLADTLPAKATILDLGAGSAIWSLTLASQVREATVTAVDWPAVLEVAAETARDLGLADRLQTIAGNFHLVELPAAEFHLAMVANVTHLLTPEENVALLKKVRGTLRHDGRVVAIDVFPGQPEGGLNRTLYALGLALRTEHGRVYSYAEFESILLAAGFREPQLTPLCVPPFAVGMLVATVG